MCTFFGSPGIPFCRSQQCRINTFWHVGLGRRHRVACVVKVKQMRLRNFSWRISKSLFTFVVVTAQMDS